MTNTLRGSAVAIVIVGTVVAFVVAETVRRAQDSNQLVAHTQQVLSDSETMAGKLVDADRDVRIYVQSPASVAPPGLDVLEREAVVDLDRLAALTIESAPQQRRIAELRQQITRAFEVFRAVTATARDGNPTSAAQIVAREGAVDAARSTVRGIRLEENRLLSDRITENQLAVRRLQWVAIALGIVSTLFGSGIFWLVVRRARRVREQAEALSRTNETLEERVNAHASELRRANARLQSIIESAVEAIVVIDAGGHIEEFNPAAERLFGYEARDVIGQKVNVLMPEPYQAEHDGYLSRHLTTGEQRIIGKGREVQGRRRDGTTFPLHLSVGKMTVNGERKFTGILHDLSDRVRMEQQLREQASLVRIGEMAAVLAHEVKNPLAGIRGAIQVIGGRLPADSNDRSVIQEIIARIDGLNELMQDLLLFARPPQQRPAPLDLERLLRSTVELFSSDPTLKNIRVDLTGTAPELIADGELLKIVFINLLVNASHAMKNHGTISVSMTTTATSCRIAVADHGPGIPANVREKIFVPFFTTKSRGSGLGLPTAKRFVEAHYGTIDVTCPAHGGTVMTVELPTAAPAASA